MKAVTLHSPRDGERDGLLGSRAGPLAGVSPSVVSAVLDGQYDVADDRLSRIRVQFCHT